MAFYKAFFYNMGYITQVYRINVNKFTAFI